MRVFALTFRALIAALMGFVLVVSFYGCSEKSIEHRERSYWVWKGSDIEWAAPGASLYLYQGDFGLHPGRPEFIKRGVNPSALLAARAQVLLVRLYRAEAPESLARQLIYLAKQWEAKGAHINEIQLDYDSPSMQLAEYAAFVRELKAALKEKNKSLKISVTGLMTWLADNPSGLFELAESSAYIHFQLYSDFHPLPKLDQHLRRLDSYQFPYKLGITTSENFQYMEFVPNEKYQGTTVFLNK